ncbi:MAG: aminotransferase class V-fold PLP-dependent enzyme [Gaiellaceae bacterium]
MTFEEARAQFPVFERFAYLNAGTNGPLARATIQAMDLSFRRDLEQGRGGKPYIEEVLALRVRAREALATVLEVSAERVALVSSTTNACNVVVAGLDLGPEDEIVTTDVEHFGLLGPVLASPARVRVARVRELPPTEAAAAILAVVTKRTRLIAISEVSWITGNSLDPHAVKAGTDAPVLVDGAQSVGAIRTEAEAFDFYTVSAQKWLCGPDATGALHVRDPERLRVALPTYMSQEEYDFESFTPKAGAARFDSVWLPPASLAGLLAALAVAPEGRYRRTVEMANDCRDRLDRLGYELVTAPGQAGLVSFVPQGDAAEIAARLYERGVVVRDLPATGWIRVSCGWWTNDDDLERLVEGI